MTKEIVLSRESLQVDCEYDNIVRSLLSLSNLRNSSQTLFLAPRVR